MAATTTLRRLTEVHTTGGWVDLQLSQNGIEFREYSGDWNAAISAAGYGAGYGVTDVNEEFSVLEVSSTRPGDLLWRGDVVVSHSFGLVGSGSLHTLLRPS